MFPSFPKQPPAHPTPQPAERRSQSRVSLSVRRASPAAFRFCICGRCWLLKQRNASPFCACLPAAPLIGALLILFVCFTSWGSCVCSHFGSRGRFYFFPLGLVPILPSASVSAFPARPGSAGTSLRCQLGVRQPSGCQLGDVYCWVSASNFHRIRAALRGPVYRGSHSEWHLRFNKLPFRHHRFGVCVFLPYFPIERVKLIDFIAFNQPCIAGTNSS